MTVLYTKKLNAAKK